jgi:hypothetical protein
VPAVDAFTFPHAPEALDRASVARWLDQLAASSGDRRYRHAASIVRASHAGRPASPDDALVTEVAWLVDTGRAGTIEAAARLVATAWTDPQSVAASTRRLARKARAAAE